MTIATIAQLFTETALKQLFPAERTDAFFEALYGDAAEGAYDIVFSFQGLKKEALEFRFDLHRRPGKCLACNLTYGLPQVFSRHPLIDIAGLVRGIDNRLAGKATCSRWKLGETEEISSDLHVVPLTVYLERTAG
ncbi:MAG: pancreas/duodenum homeobox protein 1 [Desulfobacterales bacterium]